jgi:hypothetical protein
MADGTLLMEADSDNDELKMEPSDETTGEQLDQIERERYDSVKAEDPDHADLDYTKTEHPRQLNTEVYEQTASPSNSDIKLNQGQIKIEPIDSPYHLKKCEQTETEFNEHVGLCDTGETEGFIKDESYGEEGMDTFHYVDPDTGSSIKIEREPPEYLVETDSVYVKLEQQGLVPAETAIKTEPDSEDSEFCLNDTIKQESCDAESFADIDPAVMTSDTLLMKKEQEFPGFNLNPGQLPIHTVDPLHGHGGGVEMDQDSCCKVGILTLSGLGDFRKFI